MKIKELENKIKEKIEGVLGSSVSLECPLNADFGDFALFLSSREKGEEIIKELSSIDFVEKAETTGPYLNIEIKRDLFFKAVIENAGSLEKKEEKKILVEYLAPNTNKPLHLGHLRNGIIGTAVSNALEVLGNKVIRVNLVNDRGEHICRSMLAYNKWGEGKEPDIKGDHFVGDFYVRYSKEEKNNPSLKEEVHRMLQDWERGDKETVALWKKMNSWVYEGFEETYKKFGFRFDKTYYESELYSFGKEIAKEGVKKNVFYYGKEGEILFDLPEEFGLDKDGNKRKVTILRKDGTSLYITQDLGVAVRKMEDYDPDKSIYITGLEQVYHFRCLFYILSLLYSWTEKLYHIPYNMVSLPEGKMKSREGIVIDADDLLEEVKQNAKDEVIKRYGEVEDLEDRSLKIALGAIKFQLLSVYPNQEICFDPKKSISFEGTTGPYCQYAYARTRSILEKSEIINADLSLLKEKEEIVLSRKLAQFEKEVALGLFFGIYPFYVAIPIVVIASYLILKLIEKAKIYGDTAIGIVSSAGIASGVILASISKGFNIDLFSYLFGNILAISRNEMYLSIGLSVFLLALISYLYYDFFSTSFDEEYAKITGIKTERINAILFILTAITVVLAIRIVGVMLASALLILPAATSLQIAKGFKEAILLSGIFAVLSVLGGITAAFYLDLPPGATIVILNLILFVFFLIKKKFFRTVL